MPSSFAAVPNAEARTVVQWFRDCGCRNTEIIARTGLTGNFVYRWNKREDTDILMFCRAVDLHRSSLTTRQTS